MGQRRVPLDWFAWKAQTEALDKARHARGVHLETIAGTQVGQDLRLRVGDTPEVDKFAEEPLEASRRDDLEDPRWLIAGIPEGVPLIAGLKTRSPRPAKTTSSPSCAPTRPSSTKLYSSSRL